MKRTITIEIDCGETTCYSEPGKPCPMVRTRRFGQVYYCEIYRDPHPLEVGVVGDWLQR